MEELKQLWAKKYESQGRIDITIFFINIFLFLCHIYLMIVYIIIGHKFMICANVFSLLLYFFCIPICYKNIDRYMGIAFLEIWIHLICGILSFGWTPCYQNWCFGMVAAYFLPAFSSKNKRVTSRPFYYVFLIIFSYFFLATFLPVANLSITTELDLYTNIVLFIGNNIFSFITIILFTTFYTSKSNRKELELSRKADYDELTNLYNRHALNELGEELVDLAKKNNKAYHVAILDIDHFKKINDKYGHLSGDLVLKDVANIIKKYSSKGLIPGRWGGEEFVILAPHSIRYSEFTKILEKIRVIISETKFEIENNKKINLTISVGATTIKNYNNIEEAIGIADLNLYKAKESGRNQLIK